MAEIIQFHKLEDILKGDTLLVVEFEFFDENDDPLDLSSGVTPTCQFKRGSKKGVAIVTLTVGSGLTIAVGDNGSIQNRVEINQIDILDWSAANYFYDIPLLFTATDITKTPIEGTMKVIQDTTDA